MVACFFGPIVLENHRHVDPVGLMVEFDAAIFVNYTMEPMKAKLRLDNIRRDYFELGSSYKVMATIIVSAGSHALPLLMGPQFAQILPPFFDSVSRSNITKPRERHVLFGDITMVHHI